MEVENKEIDNKEEMQEKSFFQKHFSLVSLIGIVIGGAAGYLYYVNVGCASGSCAITSSPWMSTIWGALIGYLLGDFASGRKRKKKADTSET